MATPSDACKPFAEPERVEPGFNIFLEQAASTKGGSSPTVPLQEISSSKILIEYLCQPTVWRAATASKACEPTADPKGTQPSLNIFFNNSIHEE